MERAAGTESVTPNSLFPSLRTLRGRVSLLLARRALPRLRRRFDVDVIGSTLRRSVISLGRVELVQAAASSSVTRSVTPVPWQFRAHSCIKML